MATINGSTSSSYWTFKLEVVEESTNIENNTSRVSVAAYIGRSSSAGASYMYGANLSCYVHIDGVGQQTINYVNSARVNVAAGAWLHIGTTTFYSVPHNDDGTRTISVTASFSNNISPSSGSANGSVILSTIPRKSTLAVYNGTLGTEQTLSVSRSSIAFTHTIEYSCGNYNGYICEKSTSASYPWTPPMEFAYGAQYGDKVYVSFTIYTYNGNTLIGHNTYAIECYIPDWVKPTVSVTVSDDTGYFDIYGSYVQNKSCLAISVNVSGSYYTTIKSYSITANGVPYSEANVVTDPIRDSGTSTIEVLVTDNRGRTASTSATVNVIPYNRPKIDSLTVKRTNSDGSGNLSGGYLTVIFNSTMSSLNGMNGSGYAIQYKKVKEDDSKYAYIELVQYKDQLNITNGTFTFPADTSSGYDIKLSIADNFDQTVGFVVGSQVSKLLSILKRGVGLAIGKPAELEDTFEVDLDSKFNKKVQVDGSLYVKSPSGNSNNVGNFIDYGFITAYVPSATNITAQSKVPFRLGRQLGDFFSVSDNGEVVIGASVSVVRITTFVGGSSSVGRIWAQLRVNDNPILGGDAIAYGSFCTASFTSLCLVNEGDKISVIIADACSANDGSVGCYINVERIK